MGHWWRFLRFFAQWVFVLYFGGRVLGLRRVPPSGGLLLISNHQSFFDPIMVTLALHREAAFMARDSLFRVPGFRWLIRSLNAFPVRPQTADLSAIKEALRRLRAGQIVVAFPEGTRTQDGRIEPLLPGVTAIARKARVPVLPAIIDGAFEAWPRSCMLPRPGRVCVEYGLPIPAADVRRMSQDELLDRLGRTLCRMQQSLRQRYGRPSLTRSDTPQP